MYDREVDVPRLQAYVDLSGEDEPIPDALRDAANRVIVATGVPFNSVGLNFYRDGADSVAPHSDLDDIVRGAPVALLSLGATRRMTIRARQPPPRSIHVDLSAGSLLVMSYESQLHYTHGVPKTAARVGPRISLALRVKPPRWAPDRTVSPRSEAPRVAASPPGGHALGPPVTSPVRRDVAGAREELDQHDARDEAADVRPHRDAAPLLTHQPEQATDGL
jgi:hypothetical protein